MALSTEEVFQSHSKRIGVKDSLTKTQKTLGFVNVNLVSHTKQYERQSIPELNKAMVWLDLYIKNKFHIQSLIRIRKRNITITN